MNKFSRELIKYAAILTLILGLSQPLVAERVCCEGDLWLKWTEDHREVYAFGYTLGYSKSFADACAIASGEAYPPNLQVRRTIP